ncbi:MAG: hypothetical protein ABGX23_06485 [Nautiliaceae bacterium]
MNKKEAILSVNIVWFILEVIEAIPIMILTNISALAKSALMLRSTMHFIGGMEIIVLGIGLLSIINSTGSLTLFKGESTGITADRITPKLKDTALRLWEIYILLTIIDTLLLKIKNLLKIENELV